MANWMRALLALLMLVTAQAPAMAQQATDDTPWWQQGAAWTQRRPITIDTTAEGVNVVGAIGRAPVLVRLGGQNFDFAAAAADGRDLRFLDTDGATVLNYHIESWDPQTGIGAVWVDVPGLSGGTRKTIYLYYGNAEAPASANKQATFDPDYQFVTHFARENGAPVDETAYQNQVEGTPAAYVPAGVVGRAASFQGSGVTVRPAPALDIAAAGAFSASLWVREDTPAANAVLLARPTSGFALGLAAGVPYVQLGAQRINAAAAVPPGRFTHLAVSSNGATLQLFVNGQLAGEAAVATPALTGPMAIGGTAEAPFTGLLDEVRVSKVQRPANLFLLETTQGNPQAPLFLFGASQEQGSGAGVLGYIIDHMPALDWAIVGLCMVMLLIAIAVMVLKSGYISKTRKANAVFMKRFRQMDELVSLDELDIPAGERKVIHQSPLARLYETGVEELVERRRRYGGGALAGETVEAIRSAIDAQQVTENQRYDKLMVLLTIAISGGPFIGLLGTVMGVMNTFGGVAIAGDVNVNAIAPGIAAALMATIAGLAAAIPSLFGYNYLNSQITGLSDEMRVFVDRLVTRLAEEAYHADTPPPARLAAE